MSRIQIADYGRLTDLVANGLAIAFPFLPLETDYLAEARSTCNRFLPCSRTQGSPSANSDPEVRIVCELSGHLKLCVFDREGTNEQGTVALIFRAAIFALRLVEGGGGGPDSGVG